MTAANPDYQVDLETFRGPLDLLLYLVKKDEIDVLDVPIARVARQFQEHLEVLTLIDVERAGDFLVMASTLMEIKSKMLLPRPEEQAEPEEDPRRELVRQLLQYKRVKEAAASLAACADAQTLRLPRAPVASAGRSGPPALRAVELWDLVSAFGRLLRETLTGQPQAVVVDHVPLHVHIGYVLSRLAAEGPLSLSELFLPPRTKSRLVGLFLAVLELAKTRVEVEQPDPYADLRLRLRLADAQSPGSQSVSS